MSQNLWNLSRRKGLSENLFDLIVEEAGDNPARKQEIANEFLIGDAIVHGTATFYDFIEGRNANKKAYVCNGSSCLCAGAQSGVLQQLLDHYREEEIGHVTCLGRCHENRAFRINGANYSGDAIDHLDEIIHSIAAHNDSYAVKHNLATPILTAPIGDISAYYALFDQLATTQTPEAVLATISASELRGRGGAGFPTGFKWQACRDALSDEKYIVCNADEGDPGAFSDRYLLEQRPHAILFGMLVAAWVTDAQYAVIYIRDEYPESILACEKAIRDLMSLDLKMTDESKFTCKIIRGAGAFICGEETALIRSIEGQRPMVSVRPPFPTTEGLFGKPTVVNNVETFAAVHFILQQGAGAFNALGNGKSTGSKLLSLDSAFRQPGIYEVSMATPLKEVIRLAGGFSRPVKALHIGGPLGGLVPISAVDGLTIDFESFAQAGFLLGHASIIGIPESMPMLEYMAHLFDFTAAESCGKCFPCRLGATRGKEMLRDAMSGRRMLSRELLDDLLETMELGSLCALGGGVPLPIRNTLHHFADELNKHFTAEVSA